MSIISIGQRHTTSPEYFEAHRAADNSAVLIDGSTTTDNFAIELTVGVNWGRRYGPSSNQMETIPEAGIVLKPHESVVVEVSEAMRVPHNMYGLVIPTGSLFLDSGIIIAAAKIEPAFNDRLKLRLVNISGERRTVKAGQKVASAIFFTTEQTMFHPDQKKKIVAVTRLPGRRARTAAWLSANRITWIGWIIMTLVSAVSSNALNRVFPIGVQQHDNAPHLETDKK